MSWNGSGNRSCSQKLPKAPRGTTNAGCRRRRGIIVAIVAVVVGAALCFLLPSKRNRQLPPDATLPSEPETEPPVVARDATAPVQESVTTNAVVLKPAKKLNYEALAAMGKVVITNKHGRELVMTPRKERKRPKTSIFKHSSENRIACLVMAEPGARFYGTQRYGKQFLDDFIKSCEEPILIADGDDDYTRQLKRDIIDIKIDLLDRMRNGEDICQLMSNTHKELQRMGQIRRQVEQAMKDQIKKSAQSEADVDDLMSAANKMLESKGIAPIKANPIVKRSLMRSAGLQVEPLTEADIPLTNSSNQNKE